MSDMFNILFKPRVTIDKLLAERNMKRSWQATWWITGVTVLFNLLLYLLGGEKILAPYQRFADAFGWDFSQNGRVGMVLGFWVLSAIYQVIFMVLSRFWFAWYVRMGIRMVGGPSYAQLSPEEKGEQARLVQLIHPYTYTIMLIGSILGGLLTLAVLPSAPSFGTQPDATHLVATMLGSSVSSLISLGSIAYCIVLRVFAIRKIYGVSGAKAFWGPFIPYAITYFLIFLVIIAAVVILTLLAASFFHGLEGL
ncbi:hypothetical protein [Tumebacillus flagellatus]|uniref:Yip1 domain-containing protein n=1 Tax=Tumebacillus flagellatus TaxID=1157490 RepID=A0A074LP38_9BACL|nr:hypothetical protein [Tumebacillus flagellatus]KEO83931.1 hypothetical protein EL26_07010 [Tumebacillus flagellatus]